MTPQATNTISRPHESDLVFGRRTTDGGNQLSDPDLAQSESARLSVEDNQRKLAQAQRLAHLGYWEYDFNADRVTLSDEACRILGLPPRSARTLAEFRQLIHPED